MVVADHEDAAGSEEPLDGARPIDKIGQPGDRAGAGHDGVEGADVIVERICRASRIALHVVNRDVRLACELARVGEGGRREVQPPGLGRAQTRPAEGVGADVALQME